MCTQIKSKQEFVKSIFIRNQTSPFKVKERERCLEFTLWVAFNNVEKRRFPRFFLVNSHLATTNMYLSKTVISGLSKTLIM